MKLVLPLSVQVTKKKAFILNLNNYRNAHFQVLNKAKRAYYREVAFARPSQTKKFTGPVEITYTLYQPTNRRIDISNPLSIIDKFACDALVILGVLPDDSSQHIRRVTYTWGGVDKKMPRVEMDIREIAQ